MPTKEFEKLKEALKKPATPEAMKEAAQRFSEYEQAKRASGKPRSRPTLVSLGFGDPICVSALHGHGRRELTELITERIGAEASVEPPTPVMKVALAGRRNVGKSTFINALAGQDRVIVSEVPGTTRDSVDVRFEMDGQEFLAIDTAGIRKRRKWKADIDFYGYTRVLASIRRADVVLFMIDATTPITEAQKMPHLP